MVHPPQRRLAATQPTRLLGGVAVGLSLPLLLGVVMGPIPHVLVSGVLLIPGLQVALVLGAWFCTLASIQARLVRERGQFE